MKTLAKKTGKALLWIGVALFAVGIADIYRAPDARGFAFAPFIRTDGKTVDFTQTNQPVILYFWGSWCGICRHTSPHIQSLHRSGYPVVSIAVQSGDDAQVLAYLHAHQWDFPVINDPHGQIQEAFSLSAVPTAAFVENGKIRLSTSGFSSVWGLKLRYYLLRFLPT